VFRDFCGLFLVAGAGGLIFRGTLKQLQIEIVAIIFL